MRDGAHSLEVLLLRRNRKIAFHGGAWVFPGGRVDDGDAHGDEDAELAIARRAAAREAFEEAGLAVAADEMLPFAHWTTPVGLPKRFATWFFAAVIEGDAQVRIDNSEIVDYRWLSPRAALELQAVGELDLPGPTFVTLLGFREIADGAAMSAHLRDLEIQHFVPRLLQFDGGRCVLYAEDAGYESLDMDAPGARHRLIMQGTNFDYLCDY